MHTHRSSTRKNALPLFCICLLLVLAGCKSSESGVTPADPGGEYLSCKIDGKAYTDTYPVALPTSKYTFSLTASMKSGGDNYSVELDLNSPKVGKFTSQNSQLVGSLVYTSYGSSTVYRKYNLLDKGTGTLTFTTYKAKDMAEGTFSFTGVDDQTGKSISITDGKFRVELF